MAGGAKPKEDGEEAKPPQRYQGTFAQRCVQYACLYGFIMSLKVIRAAIPSFVPIIGREFGYSEAERAILLSGFFQGYMLTQVPGAALVQRYGAKGIMSFALAARSCSLARCRSSAAGSAPAC